MAMKFPAAGDNIRHGDIAGVDSASALSLMTWFYPVSAGLASSRMIVAKNGGAAADAYLAFWTDSGFATPGAFGMTDGAPGGNFYSTNVLTYNAWNHIALVFDGSQALGSRGTCYLNGIAVSKTSDTIAATLGDNGANEVYVGIVGGGIGGNTIHVANLKLWTAALTANEVYADYLSYELVRTTNCVLWATYDDDTQFGRDYSGSGNHGTKAGLNEVTSDQPGRFKFPDKVILMPRQPCRGMGFLASGTGRRNRFRRTGPQVPRLGYYL